MRLPLLQQLRQETLAQHQSLERRLQLLRPEMSLREYRSVLEAFYGFYAPWERRAAPLLDRVLPGFFSCRHKTPLLEQDLRYLGGEPAALQECPELPAANSWPSLLGSLYVLEGATLGGQILARHFRQHFNFSCRQGCSFFTGYGSETGRRWRAFCALLDSYSSPDNDVVIVQSAIHAFRCLENWLGQEITFSC